jgi:hypothetical protein
MQYYRKEIQIHKNVIDDVFSNFKPDTKMLVFGLGYDSKMWYEGNKNTWFVENKDSYIKLNEKDIPAKNIIKYDYVGITRGTSFELTDEQIEKFVCPPALLKEGPFDIIIIDGPEGFSDDRPGRLIPSYWSSKFLSKPGTIIYVDDSGRKLETYCVKKYFKHIVNVFPERNKCTKICINSF